MGVATVVQDALHSDAAPEAFEAVVKSDVWRRLIEDYVRMHACISLLQTHCVSLHLFLFA